jgi:hypothetical protein
VSETLIIGLQCLRGKSQEERRGQKHPKLAQVGRGSPGYINRTEDGPEDDRGLQEIRKQETRRRLADFFDNKERTPVRKPATARASQENLLNGRKEEPHDLASVYVESTLYTIAAYAFGTIKKHSELRMLVV